MSHQSAGVNSYSIYAAATFCIISSISVATRLQPRWRYSWLAAIGESGVAWLICSSANAAYGFNISLALAYRKYLGWLVAISQCSWQLAASASSAWRNGVYRLSYSAWLNVAVAAGGWPVSWLSGCLQLLLFCLNGLSCVAGWPSASFGCLSSASAVLSAASLVSVLCLCLRVS